MGTIAGLVSTQNGSMVELDTGKNSYASNFGKETLGLEELGKVPASAPMRNAEFNLDKVVVQREMLGDAMEQFIYGWRDQCWIFIFPINPQLPGCLGS